MFLAVAGVRSIFQSPDHPDDQFLKMAPNGPLVPELKEMFPNAPYIARPGNINAWDNEDFVNAVKKTGRKQLIIAGVVTEVCVAFPALSAIEAGYEVFRDHRTLQETFNEVDPSTVRGYECKPLGCRS